MGRLLNLYTDIAKTAEVQEQEEKQKELFQKYAEFAEAELKKLGREYTEEDIVKVASFALDSDLSVLEAEEKIASFEEAGRTLARSFVAEISEEN